VTEFAKERKSEHGTPAGRAGCSLRIQFFNAGPCYHRPGSSPAVLACYSSDRRALGQVDADQLAGDVGPAADGCFVQLSCHTQHAPGAAELAEDLGQGSANVCTAAG